LDYRYRLAFFAALVGVFLVSFLIGTAYKMSNDEARQFLEEYRASTQGIGVSGIFVHNVSNTLGMFVPAVGVGWGIYNAWSTGAAFKILLSLNSVLSQSSPVIVLLSTPFGVMEVVSYGIAMSRSLFLLIVIVKKKPLKKELRNAAIEIGIIAGILLVAAFVESSMMIPSSA